MTRQRIAGSLLVAGSVGFGLKVLSSLLGSSSALGTTLQSVPSAIYLGSMVLLAVGAAVVAIDGPHLPAANVPRAGLALVAVGLAGLAYLEVYPLAVVGDVLENPLLVWPLYLCYPLGQILIGIALVRRPGLSRLVGALLVGSLATMILLLATRGAARAPGVGLSSIEVVPTIGLVVCAAGIALGWAGLGVLVFRSVANRPLPPEGA